MLNDIFMRNETIFGLIMEIIRRIIKDNFEPSIYVSCCKKCINRLSTKPAAKGIPINYMYKKTINIYVTVINKLFNCKLSKLKFYG